jgi:hypothetical protein
VVRLAAENFRIGANLQRQVDDRQNDRDSTRDFGNQRPVMQSWRVPGGISALGDRSTFMPTRKNRRAGQMSQREKENYENN